MMEVLENWMEGNRQIRLVVYGNNDIPSSKQREVHDFKVTVETYNESTDAWEIKSKFSMTNDLHGNLTYQDFKIKENHKSAFFRLKRNLHISDGAGVHFFDGASNITCLMDLPVKEWKNTFEYDLLTYLYEDDYFDVTTSVLRDNGEEQHTFYMTVVDSNKTQKQKRRSNAYKEMEGRWALYTSKLEESKPKKQKKSSDDDDTSTVLTLSNPLDDWNEEEEKESGSVGY